VTRLWLTELIIEFLKEGEEKGKRIIIRGMLWLRIDNLELLLEKLIDISLFNLYILHPLVDYTIVSAHSIELVKLFNWMGGTKEHTCCLFNRVLSWD